MNFRHRDNDESSSHTTTLAPTNSATFGCLCDKEGPNVDGVKKKKERERGFELLICVSLIFGVGRYVRDREQVRSGGLCPQRDLGI